MKACLVRISDCVSLKSLIILKLRMKKQLRYNPTWESIRIWKECIMFKSINVEEDLLVLFIWTNPFTHVRELFGDGF